MNLEQRLDAVVQTAIAEQRIVGAVLMVRQNGQPLYEKANGLADREAGRAMQLDAIFRLSSLTKPVVAATVLAMLDAGKLRLSDRAVDYLPGFDPTITLHHLLTHTSGLNPASLLTDAEKAAGVNLWHMGADAIMARMAAQPLLFAPGTGWAYGPGLDVLAVIAGNLVGGKPEDAIRHYVTDPLRMADSRFSVTDPARLAAAYADGENGAVLMGDPHSVPNKWGSTTTYDPGRILDVKAFQAGGGGMAGTGGDYMTLLEALRAGTLLKPETLAVGMSNQTSQLAHAQSPGWQFSYFGAWVDDPALAATPAPRGTNRWGGIYGHNWFIDPVNQLTVVSMSNTGLEGSDGAYVGEVRDAVYASL